MPFKLAKDIFHCGVYIKDTFCVVFTLKNLLNITF